MKLTVSEKNGCCKSVSIECTPAEVLVINQAMRRCVNDEEVSEENREIMEQMLDVEPVFREVEEESEVENE